MVYSNKEYNRTGETFPPPPMYMSWIDVMGTGKGRLRHHDSLKAAKKYVAQYTTGEHWGRSVAEGCFARDWAILVWANGDYTELHGAAQGDRQQDNALFKTNRRTAEQRELDAAIASIRSAH